MTMTTQKRRRASGPEPKKDEASGTCVWCNLDHPAVPDFTHGLGSI